MAPETATFELLRDFTTLAGVKFASGTRSYAARASRRAEGVFIHPPM